MYFTIWSGPFRAVISPQLVLISRPGLEPRAGINLCPPSHFEKSGAASGGDKYHRLLENVGTLT